MANLERVDYGGVTPRSVSEMVEHAHKVIAADWYSSAAERDMARMVLWALGGDRSEPAGPAS